MTVNELLNHIMTQDPNNKRIHEFDISKLSELIQNDERDDQEDDHVCIHCQLNHIIEVNENLASEVYSLTQQVDALRQIISKLYLNGDVK